MLGFPTLVVLFPRLLRPYLITKHGCCQCIQFCLSIYLIFESQIEPFIPSHRQLTYFIPASIKWSSQPHFATFMYSFKQRKSYFPQNSTYL